MNSDFEESKITTNWLEALPYHPIFNSERLGETPEDFQGLKFYGQPRTKQSCITATGSKLLIVAIDSEIRILNLMEFKLAWRKAYDLDQLDTLEIDEYLPEWMANVKYITLNTPQIKYSIRSIVVNFKEKGTLLAVVGDYEVSVDYNVGLYYHNQGTSLIAKVLWHPMSESGSHLVVLTEDMLLRMYNIINDVNEPEQTFNCARASNENHRKKGKAVSFCFGQSSEAWGNFVIYILTNFGEIYAMCPVVPNKCVCEKFFLEMLSSYIKRKYERGHEIIKTRPNSRDYLDILEQYRLQLNWIKRVFMNLDENINSDRVVFSPPPFEQLQVEIQGPFEIHPRPLTISKHPYEASDILMLGTEPLNVLVVAFNNGRIDICIEAEKIEAMWQTPVIVPGEYTAYDIILYECIDLGYVKDYVEPSSGYKPQLTTSINRPCLVPDPYYRDTFYIYHLAGAHGINIKGWLDELGKAISQATSKDPLEESVFESFFSKNLKSQINWIACTQPSDPDPLIGLTIMEDIQLCYSAFMLSSTYGFVYHELSTRKSFKAYDNILPDEELSAKSAFDLPKINPIPETLTRFLDNQGLSRQPKMISSRNQQNNQGKEIDREFFHTVMGNIQKDVYELKEAAMALQKRFDFQTKELRRQIIEIANLRKNIESYSKDKIQQSSERLNSLKIRQMHLDSKADKFIQRIMNKGNPTVNDFEKQYYDSLEKIAKAIKGENGLKNKIIMLQNRHEFLQKDYKLLKPEPEKDQLGQPIVLSGSQLSKVETALIQEMNLIDNTAQLIEVVQEKLKLIKIK
ncbi:nuclear pore component-domain-containing protein [Glomus cerebriforme]|uniref:Nuclear pore component-domain-containing protein n=1 Tax=Glomus cerebriforme TaxID=658196 RepID=A0A397TR91_9GLOM|nr:nuclear pore component-domain-containing protein [Glomus cerebriforme]